VADLQPARLRPSDDAQFPGERSGLLPHFEGWSRFEHATLAFGYGLNVTTLQLAQAYAVLANDGVRRPVSLRKLDALPEGERVFSEKTARAVRLMMETVVSAKGTARRAAIPGIESAARPAPPRRRPAVAMHRANIRRCLPAWRRSPIRASSWW
jgi:cell division protein FtsI (penicillin-binding protein 3)